MDIYEMFVQMSPLVLAIAGVLFIMSFWSVGVAIERIYTYNQAKKQSKMFAPLVAKHLKEGRLKEAIALASAKEYRYSHLAKVVLAGLQEYQFQQESGSGLSREDVLDTVRRSIQRATALTNNDLKKGVASLATIGATAPFIGLLGTTIGVINAFVGIATTGSGGIGAISAGISEALVKTALGLFVAIPAVWFYNYLSGRLEYLTVEMDNSSSELVDYFIKKTAELRDPGAAVPRDRRHARARASKKAGDCTMAMDIGGAKGGLKADINVTPLADVMLVLLIIMMIVAPLLQQGVDLRLPTATHSVDKPETQEQTIVSITADGRFWVNGVYVNPEDLRLRVEDVLEGKSERTIIIKADEDALYSAVMDCMDELRLAGIEDMGLITERKAQAGGFGGN
jgi:biopolymer transport protein ExbB/TolQ/biopolymer transport protein ExbD